MPFELYRFEKQAKRRFNVIPKILSNIRVRYLDEFPWSLCSDHNVIKGDVT